MKRPHMLAVLIIMVGMVSLGFAGAENGAVVVKVGDTSFSIDEVQAYFDVNYDEFSAMYEKYGLEMEQSAIENIRDVVIEVFLHRAVVIEKMRELSLTEIGAEDELKLREEAMESFEASLVEKAASEGLTVEEVRAVEAARGNSAESAYDTELEFLVFAANYKGLSDEENNELFAAWLSTYDVEQHPELISLP